MNSSNAIDISAQASHLYPVVFKNSVSPPHPSRLPSWSKSWANWGVAVPVDRDWLRSPPAQLQVQGTSRPPSLSELMERTVHHWQSLNLENGSKPIEGWLRIAENAQRDARNFHKQGDLELAFREYRKAVGIIISKIRVHPDYRVLSTTQRNMDQVGYFYAICPH